MGSIAYCFGGSVGPSKTKAPMEMGLRRPSKSKVPMESVSGGHLKRKLPWKWVSRGHLDEAPMEMGFPKPFVVPLKKSKKYQVIFPRQNVVNFSTKLITFWPIA